MKCSVQTIAIVFVASCAFNDFTYRKMECRHKEKISVSEFELEFSSKIDSEIIKQLGKVKFEYQERFDSTFLIVSRFNTNNDSDIHFRHVIPADLFYQGDYKSIDTASVKVGWSTYNEETSLMKRKERKRKLKEMEKTEIISAIESYRNIYELFPNLTGSLRLAVDDSRLFYFNSGRNLNYYISGIPNDKDTTEYHTKVFNKNWEIIDSYYLCNENQYGTNPEPYRIAHGHRKNIFYYREKAPDTVLIPSDISQAHITLDSVFREQGVNIDEKENMVMFHHGLGTWMRNNWGLWSGTTRLHKYFLDNNIFHADDMSAIILDSYKKRIILKTTDNFDSLAFYTDSIPQYFPSYIQFWENQLKNN